MKKVVALIIALLFSVSLFSCQANLDIKGTYENITVNNKKYYNLVIDNKKTNLLLEKKLSKEQYDFYTNYKKGPAFNLDDFITKLNLGFDIKKDNYNKLEDIFIYNYLIIDYPYEEKQPPVLHQSTLVKFYSKNNNQLTYTYLYDNVLGSIKDIAFSNWVFFNSKEKTNIINSEFRLHNDKKEQFFVNGLQTEFYVDNKEGLTKEKIKEIFNNATIYGTPLFVDFKNIKPFDNEYTRDYLPMKISDYYKYIEYKQSYIKKVENEFHIFNEYYFNFGRDKENSITIDT